MRPRVVILGGGFGGLYAAKALAHRPVDVILIDRRNFHLFQPLLYQAATGELSPADIAFPLRVVFRRAPNVRVLLAKAAGIDPRRRIIELEDGEPIPYDFLIAAPGAQNHYFAHQQWERFAPGLKSVEDATRIRHKILYAFEAAERESNLVKRRAWLTFVVVGAGPTGVELAGALGEIANDALKGDFRSIRPEEARILLVDPAPRVLPPFHPSLSEAAERALIRLGVQSLLRRRVIDIQPEFVELEDETGRRERIDTRTVLWAAGVRAARFSAILAQATGIEPDRAGRLPVQPDCSLPGWPEIFVIGDAACFLGPDGKPLPGIAPVAMQQGRYVARIILKRLHGQTPQPFHYREKGNLAVIGRAAAVAQFPHLRFSGLVAWLLWLFVHLMYLVGFQNRLVVFIRWGFNYFTYNRGARLITGPPEKTPDDALDCLHSASAKIKI